MTRVNSHIHLPPNFSAFDSVAHAVALAQAEGIGVLGVSNYYDYAVYDDFARRAADARIVPLYGLEIIALDDALRAAGTKVNDPGNPGRIYLCGKGIGGFHPVNADAAPLLETIRRTDAMRMAAMAEKMAARFADAGFDTGLDAAAVIAGVVARHGCPAETVFLQERHLARAFDEWLRANVAPDDLPAALQTICGTPVAADSPAAIQNALRSHLMKAGKPAYVEETFVGFDHAWQLILALGGVPVYPTLADGAKPICPFEAEPDSLIARLKDLGLHAAEFIPVRNEVDVLRRYVTAMHDAGMIVTAGTEHNTPDLIPLEPTCLNGVPVPDDLKAIFWEGACVLAAHQARHAQGQPGYVDREGKRTSASVATLAAEGEARIAAR